MVTMEISNSPRPRAHSAPQVSLLSTTTSNGGVVTSPHRHGGSSGIRTMQNGMATTVPQSMVPHDLRCSHTPSNRSLRRIPRQRHLSVSSRRESFEMRCCRINVLLVTMQLCLGVVVTALGFYMQTLTPTLGVRDSPYWAGIPVSIHTLFPHHQLMLLKPHCTSMILPLITKLTKLCGTSHPSCENLQ